MDIGDEAMLTEDLAFIRSALGIPDSNIALFGMMPEYMARYHSHPAGQCYSCNDLLQHAQSFTHQHMGLLEPLRRRFVRPLLGKPSLPQRNLGLEQRLARVQAALITGGGTINSRDTVGHSLRRMHGLVTYFRRVGLPVFMSGQTIGPLGVCPEHDALAKEIVDSVDVLTVRDHEYSRRYIELIGANPRRLVETFDDACTLPYETTELPERVLLWLGDGDVAAINVTEYTSGSPDKHAFVARLSEQFLDRHVSRVVFVSHRPDDYVNLLIIRDMLANPYKNRVLVPDTRQWRDVQLKKLISRCRVAVGGRYHFIVFAGTSDTPFVGMCGNHYSYIKQDGFARPLGLADFILTERETWDIETVLERVQSALSTTLSIRARCQRPSESMRLFQEWLASI